MKEYLEKLFSENPKIKKTIGVVLDYFLWNRQDGSIITNNFNIALWELLIQLMQQIQVKINENDHRAFSS